MKKLFLVLAGLLAATSAQAEATPPSVDGPVTLAPAADASSVTITYRLADVPAVVTLDLQTNTLADATGEWVSIGGAAVSHASGDVWRKVEPGARTISWPAKAAWPNHAVADGCFRAAVSAWPLNDTPDYLVMSLVTNAQKRVRYYPGADFLPGGLLGNEAYRTTSLVLRRIAAKGVTWTMGSDETAERGFRDTDGRETPHAVTLDHDYYIGVFPITQMQYMIAGDSYPRSFYVRERRMRPVEKIAFIRIRECDVSAWTSNAAYDYPNAPHPGSFLGRLRGLSRLGGGTEIDFDLPGEAEWEYACRAGHGDGFWGDGSRLLSPDQDANLMRLTRCLANRNGTAADADPRIGGTAEVGFYAPNSWGLYDMHGNVGEYCLDFWKKDITGRATGAVVTRDEADSRTEHQRRGCDPAKARYHRSAQRGSRSQTAEDSGLGFRVACRAGLE